MKGSQKYQFGFSAGALLSDAFQSVYKSISDYNEFLAGNELVDYSIIPVNSESSKKRYGMEISKRIKNLPKTIFDNYLDSNENDKRIIEFYAACKTYHIIGDFLIEVVRNKWLNLDTDLEKFEFRNYLINRLDQLEIENNLSEQTQYKLTQVFFKMLSELGMYEKGTVKKNVPSVSLIRLIIANGDDWFLDAMLLNVEEKQGKE